jgi:hypothetical protein
MHTFFKNLARKLASLYYSHEKRTEDNFQPRGAEFYCVLCRTDTQIKGISTNVTEVGSIGKAATFPH